MAIKTTIARINAAREAYEAELKAIGSNLQQQVADDFGALIPKGFYLQWQQGTPSFNDGDPCVFRVRDAWLYRIVLAEDGEDPHEGEHPEERGEDVTYLGSNSYGEERTYGTITYPAHLIPGLSREQFVALAGLWKELPSEVLKRVFGDGTEIRIESGGKLHITDYCDY